MKKILFSMGLVLLLAGLLSLSGCKTEDVIDITGTWDMSIGGGYVFTTTFSGSATSGSVTDTYPECAGNGTYTVTDTQITFTVFYPCGPYEVTFTGTIISETNMSGTWHESYLDDYGTWTLTRLL
jgi:hypothetical protein